MLIFVFSFSFAQTKVDVTKFKQEIEKAGKNAQILDVRSTYEFGKGAIKGATNIDVHDDNFEKKVQKLDKNKPVFVYCHAGGRSEEAAAILKRLGFKYIYDLIGGYSAYKK